jgi:hypothetical protein
MVGGSSTDVKKVDLDVGRRKEHPSLVSVSREADRRNHVQVVNV